MIMDDDDDGNGGGEKPKRKPKYDVGFSKPPIEHQFKKGKSGNPNGRPPKSTRTPLPLQIYRDMFNLLERDRRVKSGSQMIKTTGVELLYERGFRLAVEGHAPMIRYFLNMHSRLLREYYDDNSENLKLLTHVENKNSSSTPLSHAMVHQYSPETQERIREEQRSNQRYLNRLRAAFRRILFTRR